MVGGAFGTKWRNLMESSNIKGEEEPTKRGGRN